MIDSPSEIARRLAENAEAVCRHYLSNGRREGHYWMVGDVRNTPGRSLYVRLTGHGEGRGSAGKWTDAASGEHGDLLDIIAASCGHAVFSDTLVEARRFLSLPLKPGHPSGRTRRARANAGTPEAAQQLWARSLPIEGSLAATYLAGRGITDLSLCRWLRFHARCFYKPGADDAPDVLTAWPALIAAVTDDDGAVTGVHRTWLHPNMTSKAPVATPRRAMGHLLGHGVRFGNAGPVMVAGEGIETMLSLRLAMPGMPMIAALSAAHLAALEFPAGLKRLYVACDNDPAGEGAFVRLAGRADEQDIEAIALLPQSDDFNSDLMAIGLDALTARLGTMLETSDVAKYLQSR
ncbi:toprim domain protein (plasmid) [Blastomonas sp. RAC04]|uniref:DUF7146 domain-containing protein n=1 Tax=Blastomonas sp. RAC04 TaxID=1842535 RepID=UPI00083E4EEC|nr:toprim domain-containing protein [Blastomonas sp. RAC04]AOF98781.1 toprim domain protein [Blastomonas sp. RAC04]